MWGGIFADQPIIAAGETHFVGEVVAVLGAQTKESLAQGLAAVVAQWEKLPDIRSIDEAVAQESFIGHLRTISRGDAQTALASSPRKMKGVLTIEGADHFYLESQAAVVYPREDGQLEVHSSTQHPTETQHVVAKACGIPFSDVVCVAKRLGGGCAAAAAGGGGVGAAAAAGAPLAATPHAPFAAIALALPKCQSAAAETLVPPVCCSAIDACSAVKPSSASCFTMALVSGSIHGKWVGGKAPIAVNTSEEGAE